MAGKAIKRVSYLGLQRFFAAVSIFGFIVIIIAGVRAEARFSTIAFRAMTVMFVVFVINRVIVKILASYEEINSGKA